MYARAAHYPIYACLTINLNGNGLYLVGDGFESGEDSTSGGGTDLDFSSLNCKQSLTIQGEAGPGGNPNIVTLKNLELRGAFNGTGGNGLYLPDYNQSAKVALDGVEVEGFGADGVYAASAYEFHLIDNSFIIRNGHWGLDLVGVVNLDSIENSYVNDNGAAGNYGNIYVHGATVAAGGSVELLIQNTDIEQAGLFPFPGYTPTNETGLYVDGVHGVTLMNDYFERNLGYQHPITYGPGIASITEIGNYFSDGAITYSVDTTNVVSYNNNFQSVVTPASRYVPPGANISQWQFGPDFNSGGGNLDQTGFNGMPSDSPRATSPSQYNIVDAPSGNSSRTITCGANNEVCPCGPYRLSVYMWTAEVAGAGNVTFSMNYRDGVSWAPGGAPRALRNALTLPLTSNKAVSGMWLVWLDGVNSPVFTLSENGVSGVPYVYGLDLERLF